MSRRHDHDAGGDPGTLARKAELRDEVWTALTEQKAARFPGARNRISNFVGAEAAARRLRELDVWRAGRTVKSNPDSAQLPVRRYALEDGKTVYMAVPKLAEADPELTRAGRVTEDMALERMQYFVERVIPVCQEHKIRAACHLHDPGTPPGGFQGIERLLGNFEGIKKFIALSESPYHGLNLCLGSMMENLENPNEEIHEVIRYFGNKQRIFNIHFRNMIGSRGDFQEVYLDNGDIDMLQVMRTLVEVGYEYMVMPDHVPRHADDPGGLQAFAHSFGYIEALISSVKTYG